MLHSVELNALFCRATVVQVQDTYWVASVKAPIQDCASLTTSPSSDDATVTSTSSTPSAAENQHSGKFVIGGLMLLRIMMMKFVVRRN